MARKRKMDGEEKLALAFVCFVLAWFVILAAAVGVGCYWLVTH